MQNVIKTTGELIIFQRVERREIGFSFMHTGMPSAALIIKNRLAI